MIFSGKDLKSYRVITMGLPQLLNQLVVSIVEQQPDMEIVSTLPRLDLGKSDDETNLNCDAMITHYESSDTTLAIVRKLLFSNPEMIIVNLAENVRSGDIFKLELKALPVSELSPDSLIQLIRDGA